MRGMGMKLKLQMQMQMKMKRSPSTYPRRVNPHTCQLCMTPSRPVGHGLGSGKVAREAKPRLAAEATRSGCAR